MNTTPMPLLARLLSLGALALSLTLSLHAAALGTAFTYQGRLQATNGPLTGNYNLQFSLWDGPGGNDMQVCDTLYVTANVTNGLFTVQLDFGAACHAFEGAARWLQIAVQVGNQPTVLSPRQLVTPTPYALYAPSAGSLSGGVSQTFTGTVNFNPASGPPFAVGSSTAVTNLNADLLDGRHAASFWQLGGNAGTTLGVNFLGTTDNRALELRVNGYGALRLEYATDEYSSPLANLIVGLWNTIDSCGSSIGGGMDSYIGSGANYSVIGGGYFNVIGSNASFSFLGGGYFNRIQPNANYSFLGGGSWNHIYDNANHAVVGGGEWSVINADSHHSFLGSGGWCGIGPNAPYAFLGGGQGNEIHANSRHAFLGGGENNTLAEAAFHSFLGGGAENTIQHGAEESFLGGGYQNQIQTDAAFAVLGGGYGNWIGAEGGMVPGGRGNYVGGMYSFAAGYRAKAPLPGCFVWADDHETDFNTGVANSFNVRATGGLYFVTGLNLDGSPARTTILRDGQGIALPATTNAPMLTCGLNPFTSGPWAGLGRWGMFKDSTLGGGGAAPALHIAIPNDDAGDCYCRIGKYALDGTFLPIMIMLNREMQVDFLADVTVERDLYVYGEIKGFSDRNAKENFAPINPREVLDKVAALPLSQWNYKTKQNSPHIGPMAQDFKAAFGLGSDEKSICTVDADGVALAAIQGLNQKVEEKEAKITELEKRLAALEAIIKNQIK